MLERIFKTITSFIYSKEKAKPPMPYMHFYSNNDNFMTLWEQIINFSAGSRIISTDQPTNRITLQLSERERILLGGLCEEWISSIEIDYGDNIKLA